MGRLLDCTFLYPSTALHLPIERTMVYGQVLDCTFLYPITTLHLPLPTSCTSAITGAITTLLGGFEERFIYTH